MNIYIFDDWMLHFAKTRRRKKNESRFFSVLYFIINNIIIMLMMIIFEYVQIFFNDMRVTKFLSSFMWLFFFNTHKWIHTHTHTRKSFNSVFFFLNETDTICNWFLMNYSKKKRKIDAGFKMISSSLTTTTTTKKSFKIW